MIVVIGCGAAKLPYPARAPARRLYTGTLFRDHLRLADRLDPRGIYVASALYGLVPIDQEIESYNRRLRDLDEADRTAWARDVASSVEAVSDPRELVVVLAGAEYSIWREHAARRTVGMLDGCTLTERRKIVGVLCDTQGSLFA